MQLNKHQRFKLKQESLGLEKFTEYIPSEIKADLKDMIKMCIENRNYSPAMVRCSKTGQLRKI